MTGDKINICSLNCQGLGDKDKRRDVLDYLRTQNYSIIFLQDTHFSCNYHNSITNEWGYKVIFNSYSSQSRGVAIFFRNNFEFKIHKTFLDLSGNVIIIDIEILNKRITLANIYGPNKDDPDFYTTLESNLTKFGNSDILVVGDWNLLLNPAIDGCNYKHVNNPKARLEVLRLMNNLNLYDVWREENGDKKSFTWKRKIGPNTFQMGRLDFFLVSQSMIDLSCNENIKPGYRTDHSLINLTLDFNKNCNRKKTFWKFNNSLLYNIDFVKEVKNSILKTKEEYAVPVYLKDKLSEIDNETFETSINPQLFLEMILLKIRSVSISFGTQLKRKNENTCKELQMEIDRLENLDPVGNFDLICENKGKLQNLREQKLKGSLVRSKARWLQNGEKPSKYFCNLENRNFVSKRMTSLIDKNGKELKTDEEIKYEVYTFYQNLYRCRENEIQDVNLDHILNFETPKLNDEQAFSIKGEINYDEALKTLKNMQNNKSPGSTGFTTEFFKFFWVDLGFFVLKSINYAFRKGEFSNTQKEGIITCIPKTGKSRKFIKNWRPISLLNVTYKIASGTIANRLKKVLPSIVDLDQSGFIAGRFIGDNIRLIYDILNYGNEQDKKGLMVLIDFEKAFDTVSWSFIEKCFKFYNFKNDIISWIKTFFNKIKSTVIVNNEPTLWFTIQRGCRQGDPISPYIFLLCAEILAHMIRQNEDIKGYFVFNKEIKISQYADDTSLFLDGTPKSFETCIHTVLEYAKYSGLAMNFDKTKVVWFGCRGNPEEVYLPEMNFEWNPSSFCVLGVDFTKTLKNITDINIEKKLGQMQGEINNWSKRDLTPFGKVTVIKTLIISKIVHLLIALPSPSSKIVKKINTMLYDFLWDGKPDKIKRTIANKKLEMGGIDMIDIELFDKALKMTWIRRLVNDVSRWKMTILEMYPNINAFYMYGNAFIKMLFNEITNPFWKNVFEYYYSFHKLFHISSFEELHATSFLYNEEIRVGNDVIKNKVFQNKGIFFINNLMEGNSFLTHEEFILKYNIRMDFLTFNSIIVSIKRSTEFNTLESMGKKLKYQLPLETIMKEKKGASSIYKTLNQNRSVESKGREKWVSLLDIDVEDWHNAFCFLKFTTRDTKLRWLQFRILHNILTTNRSVSKYRENQTDLCSFCKEHSETIAHLLFECNHVKIFWEELFLLINKRCIHSNKLSFNKKLILLGQSEYIYTDSVCDLIILMAKFFIYRCKVQGSPLMLRIFIKELYERYCLEKMFRSNDHSFCNTWYPYLNLFKSLL